jgi:hypothetical protein
MPATAPASALDPLSVSIRGSSRRPGYNAAVEQQQPRTIGEYVEAIRAGLVCDRCGRYVGSLGPSRYLPPPYPIALDRLGPDDEVEALVGFEWHMLGRLRQGNFAIRHPQQDGHCVSIRDWAAGDDDNADDEDEDGAPGGR